MRLRHAPLLVLAAGLLAVALRPRTPRLQALRILKISRVVSDLDRAEAFYRDAIGFQTIAQGQSATATTIALGFGDAEALETEMRLGSATIALVCFKTKGQPYPPDSESNDLWFQHLAIVVSDMDAAYAHLSQASGWQPISQGGPQRLPPSNGGVRAFKFRDPDGHPLELIWFPAAQHSGTEALFQGIDHSALAIASTSRSETFYRGLGFKGGNRSVNRGPAQDRLDGLHGADVRVTSLQPAGGTKPGLELLGYRPPGRSQTFSQLNDTASDWVTIEVATLFGDSHRAVRDPDGHRLLLIDHRSKLPACGPTT